MADSASESDSSSVDVDGGNFISPLQSSKEVLSKRNDSLKQENRVLKMELETFKLRMRSLQEENRALRQASVNIHAKAEQEEEFISNTLMKQIKALKTEKERLALNYEQEEECLTNDLTRKLEILRQEKAQLEQTLVQEQEVLVTKLMRKIQKLEANIVAKQDCLEQLRREKVELENKLEAEQEALVNKLWKRMDKLEAEKRMLQEQLDQVTSVVTAPDVSEGGDIAANLAQNILTLKNEVAVLKMQLSNSEHEHSEKMAQFALEEKQAKEENVRLQKRLQMEVERREALCRHLSESESSLEMEEERQFNDMAQHGLALRPRASSSPSPARPLSPSFDVNSKEVANVKGSGPNRCPYCNHLLILIPSEHQSTCIFSDAMGGIHSSATTDIPVSQPSTSVDDVVPSISEQVSSNSGKDVSSTSEFAASSESDAGPLSVDNFIKPSLPPRHRST